MAFEAALAQARRAVNQQTSIDVQEWATAAMTCAVRFRAQGVADHRIQSAGALGKYLSATPIETPLSAAFREPSWTGDPESAALARNALALLTHAAARSADGPAKTLLRAYTETLLGRQTSPLDQAIHHWADAVVLLRPILGPSIDAMIIDRQIGLLRTAGALTTHVTASADTQETIERWRGAVQREAQNWANQLPHTRHMPTGPDAARHLSRLATAAAGMRRALNQEHSPTVALLAIARTLPTTNLLTTHALDMTASKTTTGLLDLGILLTQASTAFRERKQAPTRRATQIPRPETDAPGPTIPAASRVPDAEQPSVDPALKLSTQDELELGRRMDAGTLARAALDGVTEAQTILGVTTQKDLHQLIARGTQARAQLLASVYAIPIHIETRRGFAYNQDRVQAIHETLAKHIDRWDPTRARWSTWAYTLATYARLDLIRNEMSGPTIPVDQHTLTTISQSGPSTEDQVIRKNDHQAVRDLVSRLPANEARVITLRLGLDGQPRTLAEVGLIIDRDPTTVMRTFDKGITRLQHLTADPLEPLTPHPGSETPITTIRQSARTVASEGGRGNRHRVSPSSSLELWRIRSTPLGGDPQFGIGTGQDLNQLTLDSHRIGPGSGPHPTSLTPPGHSRP